LELESANKYSRNYPEKFLLLSLISILITSSSCSHSFKFKHLNKSESNTAIILIHGLNSSDKIWTNHRVSELARKVDSNIYSYNYPTNFFQKENKNIELGYLSKKLLDFFKKENLLNKDKVIIAHSQGGVVAIKYILDSQP